MMQADQQTIEQRVAARPTKAQRDVLERMAAGETILFGGFGRPYLSSEGKRFRDAVLDRTVRVLRDRAWVEEDVSDGRHRPALHITNTGRAALETRRSVRGGEGQ